MIPTTNKIFIDSSILIETYKGNKTEFYNSLFSDINNKFFINSVVLSEYLYNILGLSSGVSPRTLQQKRKIANTLSIENEQVNILKKVYFSYGQSGFFT